MAVSSAITRTRLAPSPTGALHLGNLRTFLVNHALAHQHNWRAVLRIEDLDTPRTKPGATEQIFRIFETFEISWDEGPFTQSGHTDTYRDALQRLCAAGLAYPSALSRTEADAAASAPHADDAPALFGIDQRPPITPAPVRTFEENHRFATPTGEVAFTDRFVGPLRIDPQRALGDPVVWRRAGAPAYHLAVVVDDLRQGITQIVRADDLLDSAALHFAIARALNAEASALPTYTHLPLVVGEDGRRLAKRHGDTRIDTYLNAGVPPQAIVGLLAYSCRVIERPAPMTTPEFAHALRLDTIPREPFVFTQAHHRWLMEQA